MATIVIEKNVMVPMRDGVRLATDVYRLDGTVPAPVLLMRTPYDKEHTVSGSTTFDILRTVQAGYAVVIQDMRGRYASEGAFNPHFQESHDGADTIAWAAAQSWSCGVVGGFDGHRMDGLNAQDGKKGRTHGLHEARKHRHGCVANLPRLYGVWGRIPLDS